MSPLARKRICFFNTTQFWGGGERWNLVTACHLKERGHGVSVITAPGSPLLERARQEGLDTDSIPITNRSGLNPFVHTHLRRFFRERALDTVVFNGPNDLKAGGLSARSAGVAQRVYQRGLALPVRSHWMNRYLFKNVVTHIIANSEATASALLDDFAHVQPTPNVEVIYLGVELEGFKGYDSVSAPEPRPRTTVLGTIGRLATEKNQAALLDVAALLKEQGKRFELRIAGEGSLEEELRAKAARLGVEDEVRLVGFVHDVPAFLREIDIFVLSSLWEGFGLALVEAAAAAKPVVAFDTTSTPEVVHNGTTGFLVEPGDVAGFADRVAQLMDDAGLRHRMGAAGRARVEERFSVARSIDHFERYVWG